MDDRRSSVWHSRVFCMPGNCLAVKRGASCVFHMTSYLLRGWLELAHVVVSDIHA